MADRSPHVALIALMVVPLQVLETTTSLKIVRKVHEALRHIMEGLIFNSDMNAESLLLLSHGLISENLPLLTEKAKWVPGCYPGGLLSVRRFACRNGSSQIQPIKCIRASLPFICLLFSMWVNYLGSLRARRKLGNGSDHFLNSWESALAST